MYSCATLGFAHLYAEHGHLLATAITGSQHFETYDLAQVLLCVFLRLASFGLGLPLSLRLGARARLGRLLAFLLAAVPGKHRPEHPFRELRGIKGHIRSRVLAEDRSS